MAGQRVAVRSDEHKLAAPAAHARFGIPRVIVGNDVFDAKLAFEALLRRLEKINRLHKLAASGKKRIAIRESPAVILHVCEFDARGAGRFRESQHFGELVEIAAVNDEIERYGDAMMPQPIEDAKLLRMGFRAGDFLGNFLAGALEAELKMVETSFDERSELGFIERQAGGNKIHVQASSARGADEIENVGACQGFAARKIDLQDSQIGSFVEDARPIIDRKFAGPRLQFERIRAIHTVQRAAMREFGY